ncbi:carbohydrate ABC transporter permease [Aquibacillus saliphilus]|uniref:carbohydrate ABC transporter permease n=1 Tax=Aquibacillus saliphilus TaxID=1909422 RepID=UPI001CF06EAF|nr:sugar ABC transporter permease [Aquibacillus saliphilus]
MSTDSNVALEIQKQATEAHKRQNRKKSLSIFLFLVPAVIIYLIFILYPIIATFNYSLLDWNGMGEQVFIGLDNFKALFTDPAFWLALRNNMYLVLVSIFVQVPLGLLMALVILSSIRGKRALNVLYFLPYLMSAVAIGLLWVFMFDPAKGPINNVLNMFGFESISWLASNNIAIISVLIVLVWQFAPFYMILFKASMVGIPEELYEAAEIDGANGMQKFLNITFPSLMPTIVTSSILAVVGSLKTFDVFYIMVGGSSGGSTEILGTYMYRQTFVNFNMGYGSAISAVMFVIALASVIIILFSDSQRKKRGDLA